MQLNGEITRIGVVIPAFNESANIGACLQSVRAAATACPVEVHVVVVADSCTDDTADIARAAGARVIDIAVRTVGIARAEGCATATEAGTTGLWLANTDADSIVPSNWLARQCQYASAGIDVVAGTVMVTDWHDWPPALRLHYDNFYEHARRSGRHHIHGCNLGMSASAYQRAGGFTPRSVGEDRALVDSARTAGLAIGYPDDIAVRTSARRHARVEGGGFHTFLTTMAARL